VKLSTALSIDLERRVVQQAGREVKLTRIEFDLLAYLARHPNRLIPHEEIIQKVFGTPIVKTDVGNLRVHIAHLRRKLNDNADEPRYIATEIGVGYRFIDKTSNLAMNQEEHEASEKTDKDIAKIAFEMARRFKVERDDARSLMREAYDRWLNGPADAFNLLFEGIEEGYPWLLKEE